LQVSFYCWRLPNILVSFEHLEGNLLPYLALIQDTNDQIITPIVQALNISLVFYKDVNKIKDKLDMTLLQLDGNTTSIGSKTLALCS
jgi:hypothetical protein